jgi:hypothetical protein
MNQVGTGGTGLSLYAHRHFHYVPCYRRPFFPGTAQMRLRFTDPANHGLVSAIAMFVRCLKLRVLCAVTTFDLWRGLSLAVSSSERRRRKELQIFKGHKWLNRSPLTKETLLLREHLGKNEKLPWGTA